MSEKFLQAVFVQMFERGDGFRPVRLQTLLLDEPKNGLYLPAEKYGQGTPIIRIDAFYDGELGDPRRFKRVSASQKEIQEFCVDNDDILINRVNSMEYLGKCALVKGLSEKTVFESNMIRVRVDRRLILPVYVTSFLSTPKARAQILTSVKKAVNQASINQSDLRSLQVPLPPLGIQEQFACVVQKFERLRAQQREAERQAEHLFQALLQRAFVGEP
ncbi:MAG: restriction endonuclease subunit S [Chloroflexi bacterium]|nr:restriction endonuclease subunit S [Chloroflexota bacterium]